jgi:hypothetical protein
VLVWRCFVSVRFKPERFNFGQLWTECDMTISKNINILTDQDLDKIRDDAFQSGVKRGRFEERFEINRAPVALNCANWKDGHCETCGVQWQYHKVDALHKCADFVSRSS